MAVWTLNDGRKTIPAETTGDNDDEPCSCFQISPNPYTPSVTHDTHQSEQPLPEEEQKVIRTDLLRKKKKRKAKKNGTGQHHQPREENGNGIDSASARNDRRHRDEGWRYLDPTITWSTTRVELPITTITHPTTGVELLDPTVAQSTAGIELLELTLTVEAHGSTILWEIPGIEHLV